MTRVATSSRIARSLARPDRVLAASAAALTLGVLIPLPAVRAAVVLPIALLAPGWGLAAVLGIRGRLDGAPTFALSALLSIATYPLLALVLYAASVPLSTTSVVVVTDALLLLLAGALAFQARSAAAGQTRSVALSRARGGVFFVALMATALAGLAGAMQLLPAAADTPYTQLYLAGRSVHVRTLVEARPGQRLAVEVGIANRTHGRRTYRLVPTLAPGVRWRPRGVALSAGGRWTGSVEGRVPATGCIHRLAIVLYEEGRGPVANVNLWIRSSRGSSPACRK